MLIAALNLLAYSFAWSCPTLEGRYACPASDGQPAFRFRIERVVEGKTHRYTFKYAGFPDSVAIASPKGEWNEYDGKGYWIHCVGNSLIYTKNLDKTGFLQQSTRSKKGEYVVKVNGKVAARCPKR